MIDFSSEPFAADLWPQARINCWVGFASLQEKSHLVTPKLPFQALPPFFFRWRRKIVPHGSAELVFVFANLRESLACDLCLRGCYKPSFWGLLQSRKVCFSRFSTKCDYRLVFAARNGIRGRFPSLKNVVFCVQNTMQSWRPCEIVEIVLQGLSGMREQGNTRMRIKMRKTVGAGCAQCAPSLRLVCA